MYPLSSISCGTKQLSYDEACLKVNTTHPVAIFSQVSECFGCELLPLANVTDFKEIIVSTVYPLHLVVDIFPETCSSYKHFSQHGIYGLNIERNSTDEMCKFYNISPGNDVYKPLWILLCTMVLSLIVFILLASIGRAKCFLRFFQPHSAFRALHHDLGETSDSGSGRLVESDSGPPSPSPAPHYQHRVKAIDTFRGIAVTMMIFVNAGGGQYWLFQHSPWNGLTIADLIFPWFVWIMGFSTVISVKNKLRLERRRKQLLMAAIRRTLILLALGIILNSVTTTDLSKLRIPGVLQRIAFVYIILASLEICFITPEYFSIGNSCVDKLSDILSCCVQWIAVLIMVAVHTYITLAVPYEQCPAGYLGPGGIVTYGSNCTGGIASYVDRIIFTPAHMYKHPTPQTLYHTTVPVDPEGILGVLTSCLTGFLGVQAGQILLSFYNPNKRFSRWLIWAILIGIIGGSLCHFEQNGGPIPVNKNLWSLSYALVTSSLAFVIFLVLYILIDHWMIWNGSPFLQTGRNAIGLYFCSYLMGGLFPFTWKPIVDNSTHTEYLLMNTFATMLWILIACSLARYKIYITV